MKEGSSKNQESLLSSELEAYKKEFLLAHRRYNELCDKVDLFDPKVLGIVKEIVDLKKSLREGRKIDLVVDALAMLAKQNKAPREYKEYLESLISARKELVGSSENLIKAKVNSFLTEMGIDGSSKEEREDKLIRILNSKEPNMSSDLYLLLGSSSSILQEVYMAFLKKEIAFSKDHKLVPRSIKGEKILNNAKEEILGLVSKEYFSTDDKPTPETAYFHIFKAKNNLVELVRVKSSNKIADKIKNKITQGHVILNKNGHLIAVTSIGENFISSLRKELLSEIARDYRDFHYSSNKSILENKEILRNLNLSQELGKKTIDNHRNFSEKIASEKRIDDISKTEYLNTLSDVENKYKDFDSMVSSYMNDLEALSNTDSLFQPDLARFLSMYSPINPKIEELVSSMSELSYLTSLVQEVDDFEKKLSDKLNIKEIAHDKEKITISRNQLKERGINKNHIKQVLENKLRRILDAKARNNYLSEVVISKIAYQIFSSKDFDKYVDLFIEQETVKQILIEEILSNKDIYSRTLKLRNGINCLFVIEVSKEKILNQIVTNMSYLINEYGLQKIRMDHLKQVRSKSTIDKKIQELQATHKSIEKFRKKSVELVSELNRGLNSNFRKIENIHEEINEKSAKKDDIIKNSNKIYNEFVKTKEKNKKLIEKYESELGKIEKDIINLKKLLKTTPDLV